MTTSRSTVLLNKSWTAKETCSLMIVDNQKLRYKIEINDLGWKNVTLDTEYKNEFESELAHSKLVKKRPFASTLKTRTLFKQSLIECLTSDGNGTQWNIQNFGKTPTMEKNTKMDRRFPLPTSRWWPSWWRESRFTPTTSHFPLQGTCRCQTELILQLPAIEPDPDCFTSDLRVQDGECTTHEWKSRRTKQ